MPYRKVEFRAGEHYHLYNRGVNYQPIFFERENYSYFLKDWRRFVTDNAIAIVAYCLMPNHYHLLVKLGTDVPSQVLQPFLLSYSKWVNRRYARVGPLFQGPFQAVLVDRDEYLLHLSRYIHLNPVAARLVQHAGDWEFSSYREYIGLRAGTLPHPEIVLSQFASRDEYRSFVEDDVAQVDEPMAHLLFD
jgi:REP element-mobilizing transposase RayT